MDLGVHPTLNDRLYPTLTLQPIGFLHTRQQVKFQAGHQASSATEETNVLDLLPGCGYEQALQDLAGMDRVWLLWWFHRNESWRPLVLPPRGAAQRRGVFATRSPHRPNPLGLTSVSLLGITGRQLLLGPCDLVDGTPIFDLKPYVATYDAFPDARSGWIDAVSEEEREPARFTVHLAELAVEQARWLRETWQIDFTARMSELLSRAPTPHRTRRIRRRTGVLLEIVCGAWCAVFAVEGSVVSVTSIESAYKLTFLLRPDYRNVPDREAQLAFRARWPAPVKA
jgi:tRNA-Thr(GGU) m(6)t(6)A37 methyltransferase TsaA